MYSTNANFKTTHDGQILISFSSFCRVVGAGATTSSVETWKMGNWLSERRRRWERGRGSEVRRNTVGKQGHREMAVQRWRCVACALLSVITTSAVVSTDILADALASRSATYLQNNNATSANDAPPLTSAWVRACCACYPPRPRPLQQRSRRLYPDTLGLGSSFHPQGWLAFRFRVTLFTRLPHSANSSKYQR
ncbi:hypothetical protein TPHA_0D03440 [Tetrapisispora phaffii CBS 4417]|uniref:Uncharacterized protein n=1 Tax=Tetrapisispora phaffii (strain ATCC 24235 / CBS 4417 / NBRC 1672 / NRRL Y-8282 / UCD 70-5) TaxID=1071381 RepID=G8BT08_TETPH|nr:hypothetical protein TPHA_0D03440 [Tetrapisispora phaffii CBS 4417]CCE62979.1 hypothetical protein TPHA_0D03440 [Tetrapisispora phaffii CBS 4417]